MEEKLTVKDFIEEYLIKQIGEIKKGYPYFAIILMSLGLEFLGKIRRGNDFNTKGTSSEDFNAGKELMTTYKDCKDLYENLRCGFAHSMRMNNLTISNIQLEDNTDIDVETFYKEFVKACEQVIADGKDSLKQVFIKIVKDLTTGQVTSGSTSDDK